jgi:asparagine synthase (glutamine-hydrolysing)
MCGITGVVSKEGTGAIRSAIQQMNSRIQHRGPDGEGAFLKDNISLGHRRLSIIDLSDAGNQPMFSADERYVIVFNGEIYNYKALRKELEGSYAFRTHSDTEVILAAYAHWGAACVSKLVGMFAFTIYDQQDRKLFIVRDRLGVKPLYYFNKHSFLAFASEIRSLMCLEEVPAVMDLGSFTSFLQYQTVFAPDTLIKDIQLFPAGHYASIAVADILEGKSLSDYFRPYWSLDEARDNREASYEKTKATVRDLIFQAVERRLVADVDFGAFLSGGIDSSIVVGAMAQLSSSPVNTFNVYFNEKQYDEDHYASLIAAQYKTTHHKVLVTPQVLLENVQEGLDSMDFPSGDGINTYVVSKATRAQGIKMALTGLGGDELFAGYPSFSRISKLHQFRGFWNFPQPFRKSLGSLLLPPIPLAVRQKLKQLAALPSFDLDKIYLLTREVLSAEALADLIPGNQPAQGGHTNREEHVNNFLLSSVSRKEIRYYLENILLRDSDQFSMAAGLELRVPFMDHQLVEYVLGVPDQFKYPSSPKKLLVEAVQDLIPSAIVNRPKMGFVFPWDKWLKNELLSTSEEAIQNLSDLSMLNADHVQSLWKSFLKGEVNFSRVWPLVVIGHWMKKNNVTVESPGVHA